MNKCPTCRQQPADTYKCLWCDDMICTTPKPIGKRDTLPCYVWHNEQKHPEVYELRTDPLPQS